MTTPPPQGQNPFAQGQQPPYGPPQGGAPYGQPQGGAPYGQQAPAAPYPPQPGQPGQPGVPYQPFNQGAPVPPAAPRRKRSLKFYLRIAAVIVVLIAIPIAYFASKDDAENAAVGDCLKEASSSSQRMEVVDCSSSEAKFKVLKKIDGHFTKFTAEAECRKVEGANAYYAETRNRGSEFLLCTKTV